MDKLAYFKNDLYQEALNTQQIEDKIGNIKEPSLFYINEEIKFGDISKYEVNAKVGRGRYSEVYSGLNKNTNTKVIIKILKPININKIKREVVILKYLKDCPNSVRLLDITKSYETDIHCLIYNNISGYDLKLFSINITPEDLKLYIYKILKCLKFCHSKKIMHRDIKSGNIVVNSITKELNVIDWGLSEYYIENYRYGTRVGTRYYKSPELLLDYRKYDFSIDLWAVGCIFGAILFRKDFLFKGEDTNDQIVKVAEIFGFEEFEKYLNKYKKDVKINQKALEKIKNFQKKKWDYFINSKNKYLISDEALDLLDKLLKFDQEERIKAEDALKHPYFKSVINEERENV